MTSAKSLNNGAVIPAIVNLLIELGYSEGLHALWPADKSKSELFALLKQRKGNGVGGALVRLAEVLTDGGESKNLEESLMTALKFGNEQASDDLVIAHVLSEKMQSPKTPISSAGFHDGDRVRIQAVWEEGGRTKRVGGTAGRYHGEPATYIKAIHGTPLAEIQLDSGKCLNVHSRYLVATPDLPTDQETTR